MSKGKGKGKKAARIVELEAHVARLEALVDVDLSYRDLESKFRDGTFDLRLVLGDENRPATKFLAALMLHVALGETELDAEPPNYCSTEMSLRPAESGETVTAALELIKPGGKSSHRIRQELEAELAELKGRIEGAELEAPLLAATQGDPDGE